MEALKMILFVAVTVALIGGSQAGSTSTKQILTEQRVGDSCGGPKNSHGICQDNLTCVTPGGAPPGAPGTCADVSNTKQVLKQQALQSHGQQCGGPRNTFGDCASGLNCVRDNPHLLGGSGTCITSDDQVFTNPQLNQGVGDSCGGPKNSHGICQDNLTCVRPGGAPPGAPGTCADVSSTRRIVKRQAQQGHGQQCGGRYGYCAPGLTCARDHSHLLGGSGTCITSDDRVFTNPQLNQGVGQSCGGPKNSYGICSNNLQCVSSGPPGAPGTCRNTRRH